MFNENNKSVLQPQEKKNEVNQKEDQRKFLNVEEATKYLGVSRSALYKYMHRRMIPYYKPGGKRALFKPEDLDNWVFQNRINSKEEIERRVDETLEINGQNKKYSNATINGNLNSNK